MLLSTALAWIFPGIQFEDKEVGHKGKLHREDGGATQILSWQLLKKFNFRKGELSQELRDVVDQKVRLPGFAVPLSNNFDRIEEFLFVPSQQDCIHVPPPPPNLMLYIRLRSPGNIDELTGPLWVEGVLKLKPTRSIYGKASWEMDADLVEPYQVGP